MTDVKGFFYPRTAQGNSGVIPSPPWFYSGDLLTVDGKLDAVLVHGRHPDVTHSTTSITVLGESE